MGGTSKKQPITTKKRTSSPWTDPSTIPSGRRFFARAPGRPRRRRFCPSMPLAPRPELLPVAITLIPNPAGSLSTRRGSEKRAENRRRSSSSVFDRSNFVNNPASSKSISSSRALSSLRYKNTIRGRMDRPSSGRSENRWDPEWLLRRWCAALSWHSRRSVHRSDPPWPQLAPLRESPGAPARLQLS